MQTQAQTPELSASERYLEAELDYVIANFSDISPRFRRTLRRIAVLTLLALDADPQLSAQTVAGRVLGKMLFAVEKEWPEVTAKQLVAFTEWFAGALEQFNFPEPELTILIRGF